MTCTCGEDKFALQDRSKLVPVFPNSHVELAQISLVNLGKINVEVTATGLKDQHDQIYHKINPCSSSVCVLMLLCNIFVLSVIGCALYEGWSPVVAFRKVKESLRYCFSAVLHVIVR